MQKLFLKLDASTFSRSPRARRNVRYFYSYSSNKSAAKQRSVSFGPQASCNADPSEGPWTVDELEEGWISLREECVCSPRPLIYLSAV